MDGGDLRRKVRLLTADEVAAILGIKPRTLQNWRVARYGPAFVKAGKAVFYHEDTVNRWLRESERARA